MFCVNLCRGLLLLGCCVGLACAQGPAYDCNKVSGSIEKLICEDAELAALDRAMASVYAAALHKAYVEAGAAEGRPGKSSRAEP